MAAELANLADYMVDYRRKPLSAYVTKRATVIREAMQCAKKLTTKDIKNCFIITMHNGNYKNKSNNIKIPILDQFKKEIKNIAAEQSSQLVVATNTSNTGCIRLKEQTHIKESARIDYHLRTCNNPRPNILKSKRRLTEFSTRFASLGLGRSENIEKKLSSPVYTPWKQKENFQNNKLSIIQRMNILKQKQPSLHRKREARYLLSPRKQ